MRVVNLPPGCQGLRLEDGTHYRAAREGGWITVSDDHAKAIDAIPGNGTAGLVSADGGVYVTGAKKNGRWCTTCQPARLWQPWSTACPRCGAATEPEGIDGDS